MDYLWSFLHEQNGFQDGKYGILFAYPLLPWIGVMSLGYCLGELFSNGYDPIKRRKLLLTIGTGSLILFVIIRGINVYGNLKPWKEQSSIIFSLLSFVNVTKYPPSLDYLLLTDGTALVFLSLIENRIQSFYQICFCLWKSAHVLLSATYISHSSDCIDGSRSHGFRMASHDRLNTWISYSQQLNGYGFNLVVVYLIWISVVILLYFPCKWYDRYKSTPQGKVVVKLFIKLPIPEI